MRRFLPAILTSASSEHLARLVALLFVLDVAFRTASGIAAVCAALLRSRLSYSTCSIAMLGKPVVSQCIVCSMSNKECIDRAPCSVLAWAVHTEHGTVHALKRTREMYARARCVRWCHSRRILYRPTRHGRSMTRHSNTVQLLQLAFLFFFLHCS